MTNPGRRYRNREPLSNEEIDGMLLEAEEIKDDYFRLRVKALISIAKKFGKRRSEIAALERSDLKFESGQLYVTFTLRKKHKKGLFQYLKLLKKHDPIILEKPLSEIELDWKEWTQTKEGHRIKEEKRTKSVGSKDKYAKLIIEYMRFLEATYPNSKYLFPTGTKVFEETYIVFENQHLSGRQLLRLIKPLNPEAWLHLFRETKGAEIARDKGRTLDAVYSVRET